MKKSDFYFLGFSVLALIFMILVEIMTPRADKFIPDFSSDKNIPYGCSAIYQSLNSYFGNSISTSNKPLYNYYYDTYTNPCNYLIITQDFNPDNTDLQTLFKMADKGCNFFISAMSFGQAILDTFSLKQTPYFQLTNLTLTDTTSTTLFSETSGTRHFVIPHSANYNRFSTDKYLADTLGVNGYGQPDFIELVYGHGIIFLNCEPFLFTNYHFLDTNRNHYSEIALNYLPDLPVVWDEYYKPNKQAINNSPVRYILSQPALRMAWYCLLIALVIYIFTGGRRLQRPMAILKKPRNTSVEFVEILGRLYFNQANHIDLVNKKMMHWENWLRTRLNIDTNSDVPELYQNIAAKSGVPFKDIENIYRSYNWIKKQAQLSDDELKRFTGLINQFYKQCK
jgi:hypothetical protein